MLLGILLACSSEEAPTEPSSEPSNEPSTETGDPVPVEEVEYIWMSDIQKLNRISMALRGTRPDSQDVVDVLEDPNQLESIVDRYLDSPEFGATIHEHVRRDIENAVASSSSAIGRPVRHIYTRKKSFSFRGTAGANRTHRHDT